MNHFESHDDQAFLDLQHGLQLAACRRLAAHPPAEREDFSWLASPPAEPPWRERGSVAARADALDAADLHTCYAKS